MKFPNAPRIFLVHILFKIKQEADDGPKIMKLQFSQKFMHNFSLYFLTAQLKPMLWVLIETVLLSTHNMGFSQVIR